MEQIFQFFVANYGSLGVFVILLAAVAFLIIKELRKSNKTLVEQQLNMNKDMTNSIVTSLSKLSETLTNDLREQNTKLFNHILEQRKIDSDEHQNNLINRRKVSIEINKIIEHLRVGLGAKRVSILEFHNSFANQTGFPFLKFTMTYEKMSKGCIPIQQTYQGSQFSSICEICEKVLEQDDHIYELYTTDEINDIVPIMHINQHTVNACLYKGIFNTQNNLLIGLLCVEFDERVPKNYNKIMLMANATTIGELITLSSGDNQTIL